MKRFLLFSILTFSLAYTICAQQKLVFTNSQTNKTEIIETGDVVKFIYSGYLGQLQEVYGRIELINDSFLRFEGGLNIRVNDILGFRRFGKHREFWKSITTIVSFTALLILVPRIIKANPAITDLQSWSLSIGSSISLALINKALFPSRIKNFMSSGWKVKVE